MITSFSDKEGVVVATIVVVAVGEGVPAAVVGDGLPAAVVVGAGVPAADVVGA